MCRSVPHKPTVFTRIKTSLGPMAGTGTRSRVNPGAAVALRRARIVVGMSAVDRLGARLMDVIAGPLRRGGSGSPRKSVTGRSEDSFIPVGGMGEHAIISFHA